MTQSGWIFPGQGAQSPGMGAKFFGHGAFDAVIDRIEAAIAQPVRDYVSRLSDSDLRRTDRAQLAIFAVSMGIAACLRAEGHVPVVTAGHSLGHFSALTAAGAIELEDAAQLVALRGQLMLGAGDRCPGGMAVVQGIDADTAEAALKNAAVQVWLGNLNLPDQNVVSGAACDMDTARNAIEAVGGRWMPLNVSGAFHSPLLREEANVFAEVIAKAPMRDPACPVIGNTHAQLLDSAEGIVADLAGHMTGQVRWCAVMEQLSALKPGALIEVGPGKVLTGLMLRFNPALKPAPTATPALLARAAKTVIPVSTAIQERNVA